MILLVILFAFPLAAQSIINYSPTVKAVVLGSTECRFWLQGAVPGQSQWAVYVAGQLGLHPSIPVPARNSAITPCPPPLDSFQIAVDAAGNITASIKQPPPFPATGGFPDAVTPTGAVDGTNVTFFLPTTPARATSLLLWWNGLLLKAGLDYTLAGRTITMLRPLSAGGSLQAVYI
jgi:hypothetical protein